MFLPCWLCRTQLLSPKGTRVHLLWFRVMFVAHKHSSSLWEPAKIFVSAMTVHTASQRSTCEGNLYGEAHYYCPVFENILYSTRVLDSGGQLPNVDAKWVKDAAHRLPMGWLGWFNNFLKTWRRTCWGPGPMQGLWWGCQDAEEPFPSIQSQAASPPQVDWDKEARKWSWVCGRFFMGNRE